MCRSRKEIENIGKTHHLGYLNFSPWNTLLNKTQENRNIFLILLQVARVLKKKKKVWNSDYLQTNVNGIAWSVEFFFLKDARRKEKSECNFQRRIGFVNSVITSFCLYAKKIVSSVPSHSTFVLRQFHAIVTTTNFLSKCLHYLWVYFRN